MPTRRRKTKQKDNTICVWHHYAQTNTNNVNSNRTSFLCGNRNGTQNVKSHNRTSKTLLLVCFWNYLYSSHYLRRTWRECPGIRYVCWFRGLVLDICMFNRHGKNNMDDGFRKGLGNINVLYVLWFLYSLKSV